MRNVIGLSAMAAFLLCASVVSVQANDDDDAPKYTIKQVMMEGMKGGLLRKVAGGDASEEEQTKMVEMVKSLEKYEVKKGTQDEWKEKVTALSKALKATLDGDADGPAALKKAANCAACHKVHKP